MPPRYLLFAMLRYAADIAVTKVTLLMLMPTMLRYADFHAAICCCCRDTLLIRYTARHAVVDICYAV